MSGTPRFLMCRPDHFDVTYEINPWMTGNVKQTSSSRALEQWERLEREIAARAHVDLIAPAAGLPDMPFVANAGFVLGSAVVPTRFRCPERAGEEAHFERWFRDHDFSIAPMPVGIAFEGAGDALIDRGRLRIWAGWGHRSARESHDVLARAVNADVISLNLVDPRFYHLDTCFCPLEGGYVMYFPDAFDAGSVHEIERLIPEHLRIPVEESDALHFACNAVNIGSAVILNRASTALKQRLSDLGFSVIEITLTEFLKAGGSAKCLTLRLDEPRVEAGVTRRSA